MYLKMRSLLQLLLVNYGDDVHMQPLTKGSLLIKDTKLLDHTSYLDFIDVLVALRKRI
jgi:hypothetical protein